MLNKDQEIAFRPGSFLPIKAEFQVSAQVPLKITRADTTYYRDAFVIDQGMKPSGMRSPVRFIWLRVNWSLPFNLSSDPGRLYVPSYNKCISVTDSSKATGPYHAKLLKCSGTLPSRAEQFISISGSIYWVRHIPSSSFCVGRIEAPYLVDRSLPRRIFTSGLR